LVKYYSTVKIWTAFNARCERFFMNSH